MTRQRLADLSKARAVEEEEARALRERAREAGRAPRRSDDAASAKALADLRATRDMLLATLDSRVDELRAARRRLAELEGGAQEGGGARTSAPPDQRPEAATADARALEAALAAARADRDRLESELASLRRALGLGRRGDPGGERGASPPHRRGGGPDPARHGGGRPARPGMVSAAPSGRRPRSRRPAPAAAPRSRRRPGTRPSAR